MLSRSLALLALAAALPFASLPAPASADPASPPLTDATTMTSTEFTSIDGKPFDLASLGAKAVLVVNTASKCGYTPQYEGLEALYEAYKDKGLVIVGVPSNDFGGQEPGTEAEVKTFCQINYGVTFPLTQKYAVTGAEEHPFYLHAVSTLGEAAQPKWNFHKILASGDGTPLKAYPSATKPADAGLVADIEAALGS
ncbi:glutathione peroxidase [Hyphomonas johnsonii]|uniref:Glutathione peroxidase n=1 Tax=Hyphomonas johnsonii MHS-2 TaxID=1280950 RepID=A0A059FPU9_9PROT|nr:glutathione peroxidase [Hyphomonas johnsonii]KCZ92710.1 glutathione peroxidase [Hyphomonas johnsonii MHS-2]